LHADAPGILVAKAFLSLLDEEFEAVIDYKTKDPEIRDLQQQLDGEASRLEALVGKAGDAHDDNASGLLDKVPDMEDVSALIKAANGDPDSANKAEKLLLELRIQLDKAEDMLKWPALVAEALKTIDELDSLIEQHGTDDHRQRAAKLREQIDELIEQKRTEPLRKNIEQVIDFHREILFEQDGFWLGFFNHLVDQHDKMRDQQNAERLINQGRQCISRGNVNGLRNAVAQLLALMPRIDADEIRRGYISGIDK
jgi:molecular chaperone DnaK